jgi:hypothetical protein
VSRERTLEWQRRWALPAALAAFAAAAFFVASLFVGSSGDVPSGSDADILRAYADDESTRFLSAILSGIGMMLLAGPLAYLFRSAAARSPGVRRGLIGVVFIGPIFLGLGGILQHFALAGAADDFANSGQGAGVPVGEYAEDVIRDQALLGPSTGLFFAGLIALAVGTIYSSLWAMRVGLVTRFFGTFGMALGAAAVIFLLQPFLVIALMMWAVWLGLIFLGKVPGGAPPAWEAGEAIPWPRPGETPDGGADDREVEGEAQELFSDADADADAGDSDGASPNAARRERAKRRKRKQRRG